MSPMGPISEVGARLRDVSSSLKSGNRDSLRVGVAVAGKQKGTWGCTSPRSIGTTRLTELPAERSRQHQMLGLSAK
jgi:hypothetical protein